MWKTFKNASPEVKAAIIVGCCAVLASIVAGLFQILPRIISSNPPTPTPQVISHTPTIVSTVSPSFPPTSIPTQVEPKTTPTPQQLYFQVTSGNPALSDPLSHQDSYNWDESASCTFVGGTYHVSWSQPDNFFTCTPNTQLNIFDDFAIQVQMTIIDGDYGGLIFRVNSTGTDYYSFNIYQSGQYSLDVYQNNHDVKSVSVGTSSAFKTGLNQSNLVTVIAVGNNFYLYMNGQFVAHGSDSNYSAGSISLLAGEDTHPTEVAFSNLKVWSI